MPSNVLNPELVGLARVDVETRIELLPVLTYDFSNGFETGTPEGATAGADPLTAVADGDFAMFLDDPVQYGDAANQGGLFAVVTSCETGSNTPVVAFGTVSHGDVAGLDAAYANVDPMKVLRVRFYDGAVPGLVNPTKYSIAVYRNPMTII